MSIARRAKEVSPSLTLAITAKAKKMQEDGIKVVSFGAGEPDCNTPDYIVSAAKVALDKGMHKYTPSAGTVNLRKAICEKFKTDNNLIYEPSQIVVSNGAKHSLYNAMQVLVDDGDEVIIPAPYWLTYPELVRLSGGVPVFVDCDAKNNFKMTPAQFKSAITKKTKVLVLNSPSNPTGTVYTKDEITALAKVALENNVYVISDEIYEKLVYNGATHFSIAQVSKEMQEKTIVINGVSKTYAMTGWRIGYLAAAKPIATAIDNMQSHTTSNANSIAQYATQIALSTPNEFVHNLEESFCSRKDLMLQELAKVSLLTAIKPQGAFYVMVDVSKLFGKTFGQTTIKTAQNVAEVFLDLAKVAVIPCESFGAPNYIRLSYAVSKEDIVTGINNIAMLLNK